MPEAGTLLKWMLHMTRNVLLQGVALLHLVLESAQLSPAPAPCSPAPPQIQYKHILILES